MTILSKDSIRERCVDVVPPLISPFLSRKHVRHGTSHGLSHASYDMRIDLNNRFASLQLKPGKFALVHTIEKVDMPLDLCAMVLDKSSWARRGLSVFNTFFDPGFRGYPTLELANNGNEEILIQHAQGICQFVFMKLDKKLEHGYGGKYQDQPAEPVSAIHDKGKFLHGCYLQKDTEVKEEEI